MLDGPTPFLISMSVCALNTAMFVSWGEWWSAAAIIISATTTLWLLLVFLIEEYLDL